MVAFGVVGVDFVHGPLLPGGQVDDPQVGVTVPDVEAAVFPQREHEEATVGRDSRQRRTHAKRVGIEDKLSLPKLPVLRVELLLVDVVFHLLCPVNDLQGV